MRFGGLIAAVAFAAIAAVVVLRMSGSNDAQPAAAPAAEAKNINIYVATKPLPIGTTIAETDVGVQPWPEHLALEGFVVADGKTNLVGMVTRAPMQQNEPVTTSKVANPNDPNFLAGELPKGMRVITIPVNETDGVAGFIFPGDHVDLIYTHDVDKWEYPPNSGEGDGVSGMDNKPNKVKQTVTETLLTNVKVLAIDQRSSGAGAVDQKGNLVVPRSASLMVSASDSQRVRLAQHTGRVSMVLRALADKESADPLVLTMPKDVSQSAGAVEDAGPQGNGSVRVVRGVPDAKKESIADTSVARGVPPTTGVAPTNNIVTPGLMVP